MDWNTIIGAAVIGLIFAAIVVCGIINKKKGKGSCSCSGSCGGCAMSGSCHKTDE